MATVTTRGTALRIAVAAVAGIVLVGSGVGVASVAVADGGPAAQATQFDDPWGVVLEPPRPRVVDVTIPDTATVGETFTVSVRARNFGGVAGAFSTISVSVPSLDDRSDADRIRIADHDLGYAATAVAGETIHDRSGDRIDAEYALAEAGTTADGTWDASATHEATVELTPAEAGQFVVYVRATMTDPTSDETDTSPDDPATTDQQGYGVFRYVVDVREPATIDAAITDYSVSDGQYDRDETVTATATVENTGNREHTFFVGYSVIDDAGTSYDNDAGTGRTVTLAPGESRTVTLSWDVQEDAPIGQYDARISVWEETDRDSLSTRLADQRVTDAFEIAPTVPVIFEVSKESTIEGYDFSGEPVAGATVEIAGRTIRTGEDGTASFELPAGSDYEYTVSADGYESISDTLSIDSTAAQVVGVGLVRTGVGVLEVSAVDESGDPLAGNAYQIRIDGEHQSPNADGELLLQEGRHTVELVPTDFGRDRGVVATERTVQVTAGERSTVTMTPIRQSVDPADLSYTVQSINGDEATGDVFSTDNGIVRQVTIRITDGDRAVTGVSPRLVFQHDTVFTATEVSDGVYRFSSSSQIASGYTAVHRWTLTFAEADANATIEVPVDDGSEPLPGPIEGWASMGVEQTVTVDGSQYHAIMLMAYDEEGMNADVSGWLLFTEDGRLVRDPEIARRGAQTAEMAHRFRAEETMQRYFGEEYPNGLRRVLGGSQLLHVSVTVRDQAAGMLGAITASYATGGATVAGTSVAGMSGREAAGLAARELASGVAEQLVREQLEDIRAMSDDEILDLYERTTRQKAHDEMRDAISQSEEAARVLEAHPDGENWSYEEARVLWRASNESIHDGILWSEVRVQTMPSGAPADQLRSIAINFADGATGSAVPVADLADLLLSGETGEGYRRALRETASIRQRLNRTEATWTQVSPRLQADARAAYGGGTVYQGAETSGGSATIEVVDAPSGSYTAGEWANATVRVRNTGTEARRFFVGYSLRTETDSGPLLFDADGSTGHWISLAPRSSTTTEVAWRVQSGAPTGQSYDAIVAVWGSFPGADAPRYDDATVADAFTIASSTDISVTGLSAPDSATADSRVEITVIAENTGTAPGQRIVNLTEDGDLIAQQVIAVSNETASVDLTVTFETAGEHTVAVDGRTATVSVSRPDTPTPEPDTETSTPEPDTETSTPEPDTETPTPEPDTETPTPEPDTETPTPEPDTETQTPEPDTETQTPEPDTETQTAEPDTETPTPEPDTERPAGDGTSVFEVVATEQGEINYELVVRGTVEKERVSERVGAGVNDEISRLNDTHVLVSGYTGNTGYGDAYRIDGEIVAFRRTGGDVPVQFFLDGQRVTPAEFAGGSGSSNAGGLFEVVATEQGEINYELVVRGTVEKERVSERVGAGVNDEIRRLNDTHVLVSGYTGNTGYGDAYRIDGEIVAFRRTGGDVPVQFFLDGRRVTVGELNATG